MPFADIALPPQARKFYRFGRIALYLGAAVVTLLFLLETLFPTFYFSFDTRSVRGSNNPLLDPRLASGSVMADDTVPPGEILIANMSALGQFSDAEIRLELAEDSVASENMTAEIRKSYRSFLLPVGDPLESPARPELYRIEDTYYERRTDTLYPFVSEGALLSRFPLEWVTPAPPALLERLTVSEEWLGYRIGSLLSFADGVFVVVSDAEVRPIGSADIFLALGYRFADVIPASAEEVGIYERGRIFLLGDTHPPGTLLWDQDREEYWMVSEDSRHLLAPGWYRDFVLSRVTPVTVSSADLAEKAACSLEEMVVGENLYCEMDIVHLQNNLGADYEISFSGHEETIVVDPKTRVALSTDLTRANLELLYGKLKNRVLARFGLVQL